MSVDFYVKVRDAGQLLADAAQEQLEKMVPPEAAQIDLEKIKWDKATGEKGDYEKSDDVNNPEFKKLLKILGEHKGKMSIAGYFVWQFTNATAIGRKKRK